MTIGRPRAVPARAAGRGAVDDRHAAAQRHRLAAHRPCARQYAAGRPDPPRADARQGRAVGGRHRPCRHRHADGRRAQPRRARGSSAPRSAARPSSSMCGSGRRSRAAQITRQLRRLGARCDWANERFTMDEGFSKAVIKVFVELYKRRLLYRAKRLVNWDPKFQTAISDLEVENREVQGHMWHFKYPLAGGETYTYVEKRRGRERHASGRARLHLDRHDAARDDARRRRGRGASGRRALPADRRQALRDPGRAEGAPPPDPDHHRRLSRSRISARARSRSPARTTSTTMASRSATASRCTG